MKLNRRNFIRAVGATLAAAVTRKWPAIKWPEPVKRAARQDFYVNKRCGSDNNDGLTPDRPKATIGAAMRQCGEGAVIYVDGGCYEPGMAWQVGSDWLVDPTVNRATNNAQEFTAHRFREEFVGATDVQKADAVFVFRLHEYAE